MLGKFFGSFNKFYISIREVYKNIKNNYSKKQFLSEMFEYYCILLKVFILIELMKILNFIL